MKTSTYARSVRSIIVGLMLTGVVEAFSASSVRSSFPSSTSSTRIGMSSLLTRTFEDESSYHILLTKARECAFSEKGSGLDAKLFLSSILELESGCASGTVSDPQVCDTNVVELSEIVAQLRHKVKDQQERSIFFRDVSFGTSASILAVLFYLTEYQWPSDSVSFTFEEWMWAAQGGYLDTMIAHFARNGGL